jgi:ribosomal protein S2
MANVSLRELLEAGVHFGHQTRRWNPRMRPYIYGQKNGVHIIDIQQTARALVDASRFVTTSVSRGQPILFVGTKRAAREIVAEEARRAQMFFVNDRWLGGTLTNFQTVKKSIERLNFLTKSKNEGKFEQLTKKEALTLTREIEKMEKSLGGIKDMRSLPGALFVIDPKKEHIPTASTTSSPATTTRSSPSGSSRPPSPTPHPPVCKLAARTPLPSSRAMTGAVSRCSAATSRTATRSTPSPRRSPLPPGR